MWKQYNPNPRGNQHAGDCVIRAISKATGYDWEKIYSELSIYGYSLGDWGNSNGVWDAIKGKKVDEVLEVFEELMTTLQLINPRLYEGVMRKL